MADEVVKFSRTPTGTTTTYSSGRTTSTGTSGSSSTTSKPKVIRSEIVNNVKTEFYSDGSSKSFTRSDIVGSGTAEAQASREIASPYTARVDGEYYKGLTASEAVSGKLSPLTKATREQTLNRRLAEQREAQRKFQSDEKLTSGDLFRLQAGLKKEIGFGTKKQKEQITSALKEREEFFATKSQPAPQPVSKSFTGGVISASTPAEIRAGQPVYKQILGFKAGFQRVVEGDTDFIRRLREDPSLSASERIGGVFAAPVTFALTSFGGALATSAPAISAEFGRVGALGAKIGKPIAVGLTAQAATTGISKALLPENLKRFEDNKRVQLAYEAALKTAQSPAPGSGVGGEILSGVYRTVPTTTGFFRRDEFIDAFQEELSASGFLDARPIEDLKDATGYAVAKLARTEGGEFAALVGAGAATEIIGSKTLSGLATKLRATPKLFTPKDISFIKATATKAATGAATKSSSQILKTISTAASKQAGGAVKSQFRKGAFKSAVFKEISTLGFAEGVTESLASDIARGRAVDVRKAVATGAIAAPLAGFIGTRIAISRGVRQKARLAGAYLLDPSEPFGDVVASLSGKILKGPSKASERVQRAIITSPAFSASSILFGGQAVTPPPTPTLTPEVGPTKKVKSRAFTIVPTNVLTIVPAAGAVGKAKDFATFKPTTLQDTKLSVGVEPSTFVPTDVPTTVTTSVPTTVATSVPTTVPVPIIIPKPFGLKIRGGIKADQGQGYNVLIKQGGKFIKANEVPLSYGSAVSRGSHVVDNTAAATFKIVKTKKQPKPNTQAASSFNRNKFRGQIIKGKEKASPTTFIEENAYRIDSRGELQGITAKAFLKKEQNKAKARKLSNKMLNGVTSGKPLKLQAAPKMTRNIGASKLKAQRFKL